MFTHTSAGMYQCMCDLSIYLSSCLTILQDLTQTNVMRGQMLTDIHTYVHTSIQPNIHTCIQTYIHTIHPCILPFFHPSIHLTIHPTIHPIQSIHPCIHACMHTTLLCANRVLWVASCFALEVQSLGVLERHTSALESAVGSEFSGSKVQVRVQSTMGLRLNGSYYWDPLYYIYSKEHPKIVSVIIQDSIPKEFGALGIRTSAVSICTLTWPCIINIWLVNIASLDWGLS